MKVKAVRLHAANDLRLDTFELPEIKDDEILVKVVEIDNQGRINLSRKDVLLELEARKKEKAAPGENA